MSMVNDVARPLWVESEDGRGVTAGYRPSSRAMGFRLVEALAGYRVPVPSQKLDDSGRVSWAWADRDRARADRIEEVLARGFGVRRSSDEWSADMPVRSITSRQALAALQEELPLVPESTLRSALRALRTLGRREERFRGEQMLVASRAPVIQEHDPVDLVDATARAYYEPGLGVLAPVYLWAVRRRELITFLIHMSDVWFWDTGEGELVVQADPAAVSVSA